MLEAIQIIERKLAKKPKVAHRVKRGSNVALCGWKVKPTDTIAPADMLRCPACMFKWGSR